VILSNPVPVNNPKYNVKQKDVPVKKKVTYFVTGDATNQQYSTIICVSMTIVVLPTLHLIMHALLNKYF
jgi:hypothetical protein